MVDHRIEAVENAFGNIASNSPIDDSATRKELAPEPELRQAVADEADIGFVDPNSLIVLRGEVIIIIMVAMVVAPTPPIAMIFGATLTAPKARIPTTRTMFKTSERRYAIRFPVRSA